MADQEVVGRMKPEAKAAPRKRMAAERNSGFLFFFSKKRRNINRMERMESGTSKTPKGAE